MKSSPKKGLKTIKIAGRGGAGTVIVLAPYTYHTGQPEIEIEPNLTKAFGVKYRSVIRPKIHKW